MRTVVNGCSSCLRLFEQPLKASWTSLVTPRCRVRIIDPSITLPRVTSALDHSHAPFSASAQLQCVY